MHVHWKGSYVVLYCCCAHKHLHIIQRSGEISPPLFSVESIRETSIAIQNKIPDLHLSRAHSGRATDELLVIGRNAHQLARHGISWVGFNLREAAEPDDDVREQWEAFRQGTVTTLFYMRSFRGNTLTLPLYCDFVHRRTRKPDGRLEREQWDQLAMERARYLHPGDLGITWKTAEVAAP